MSSRRILIVAFLLVVSFGITAILAATISPVLEKRSTFDGCSDFGSTTCTRTGGTGCPTNCPTGYFDYQGFCLPDCDTENICDVNDFKSKVLEAMGGCPCFPEVGPSAFDWDALYRCWMEQCCDSDDDGDVDCDDLTDFLQNRPNCDPASATCEFLKNCGGDYDGVGGLTCSDLDEIIACVEDATGCALSQAQADAIEACLEGITGACTPDHDCCREIGTTGLYYNACVENSIKCDQDCDKDGDTDCDDLKTFISRADDDDCNTGEFSRQDILDLACEFMKACGSSTGACDMIMDCLDEILEQYLGEEEAPLTDDERKKFTDGTCSSCTFDDPGDGKGDGGEEGEGGIQDCKTDNSSNPESPDPIDLTQGHKVESGTDIQVKLTGRDFKITSAYRSNPDITTANIFGVNWSLSCFNYVDFDSLNNTIYWTGGMGGSIRLPGFNGTGSAQWPGPTSQTMSKADVTIDNKKYAVWRIEEPGQWQMDYYRANATGESGDPWVQTPTELKGHLLQTRDEYSNANTYEYLTIPISGSNRVRLRTIYLNGTPGMTGNAEAEVRFFWNLYGGETNYGRLQEIRVVRFNGSATVVTQKVTYTYVGDEGITFHADVGTDGDLAQVVKYTRVDRNLEDSSGAPAWREMITQYRYHTTSVTSGPRNFTWDGNDHMLKMIIQPEQIEYYAQQDNVNTSPAVMPRVTAEKLLPLADGATVFTEASQPVKLVDLASKVIEDYITTNGKVETQYIQSACGCGGGSTQGMKMTYVYYSFLTVNWTTKITEYKDNGSGGWTLHRTIYNEMTEQSSTGGDTGYPYLTTKAIVDGTKKWVTHYEYDSGDRNLSTTYTPASISAYTPGSGTATPIVTKHSGTGLVYTYGYTATDNRLTTTSVKKGSTGPEKKISVTTYGDGTGAERMYLPKKIERMRTDDNPTDAAKIEVSEFVYGFHTSGGDDLAWVETKVEAELEAENGPTPNGYYYSYSLFDTDGTNHWSRSADGALTKRDFQTDTSAVTKVIRNHDGTGLPSGTTYNGMNVAITTWTSKDRNGEGGTLTTEYTRDLLGRVQERVSPSLVSTYTMREMREWPERPGLLYYTEVSLPHNLAGTDYDGPATIGWYNGGGNAIGSSDYTIGSGGYGGDVTVGYTLVISSWDDDTEIARSAIVHDVSGLTKSSEVWHDVSGDSSYTSSFEYDTLGRLETTIDALGTYSKNTYDVLNRVTKVEVGTSSSNLVTVSEYEFDNGATGMQGNSNLTKTTAKVDSNTSNDRVTKYQYDWRDRLQRVEAPVAPHTWIEYDNLNRKTEEAVFRVVPTGIDVAGERTNRGLYKSTDYSQRGMAYKQSIAIDPNVAVTSMTFLETNSWFDEVGRTVASWSPNGPGTYSEFDGLGRPETTYVIDRGGDADPGGTGNYADVYNATTHSVVLTDDVVLEERKYSYHAGSTPAVNSGMLYLVKSYRRVHDASDSTDTGKLSGLASTKSIITYTGTEFDKADRVITSLNFGTNQTNDEFKYGGSAPTLVSASDPPTFTRPAPNFILETATTYDDRNLVEKSTSPDGDVAKYLYDDLSRSFAVIENYVNATVTWNGTSGCWEVSGIDDTENDTDRVTTFVYDGGSNVTKQIAHYPSGTSEQTQITTYDYGVIKGTNPEDSELNHNGLLKSATYPDDSSGTGVVFYSYDRLGETEWTQDQNDSTHSYTRDKLGRVTQDEGAVDSGNPHNIDDAYDTITVSYDTLGRADEIKTLKKSDNSALNTVKFKYTDLWQISEVIQDVDGDNVTTSPKVIYTYDDNNMAAGNWSRLDRITYPLGQYFDYEYGLSSSASYAISRVEQIGEDTGGFSDVKHALYDYIGLGMVVVVDYGKPDIQLDYQVKHEGNRDAGEYAGFDRFGRTVHHTWVDGNFTTHATDSTVPNIPPLVELNYEYNKDSNRTKMLDGRPGASQTNRDMVYTYDGIDRLDEAKRGVDGGTFSYDPGSQKWDLAMLGNWSKFFTDTTGDGLYTGTGEETRRSHNDVNELTGIDTDANGTNDLDLTFDDNGNLREQDLTSNTAYRNTHDLWNRLVKVEHVTNPGGSETIIVKSEYEYFGTHWRSIKKSDTDTTAGLDEKREQYYSAGWQLLEERIDDSWTSGGGFSADRNMQYVWGLRYIDDSIVHREDVNGDGNFTAFTDKRWWHLTDVQFSTVANINDAANLIEERIMYDAYGNALQRPYKDVDGDRDYDVNDYNTIQTLAAGGGTPITSGSYNPDADLDRSGTIDSTDVTLATTTYITANPAGQLSNSTVKNTIGWDGYVYNSEAPKGNDYLVRFRSYSTELGRWLERDPLTYVDGMNIYEMVISNPIRNLDKYGLDIWDKLNPFTQTRSNKTNCTTTVEKMRYRFREQSIALKQKFDLPTGGWLGIVVEIGGQFADYSMVTWQPMGKQGRVFSGPGFIGKACKCTYDREEYVCTTCCVQKQRRTRGFKPVRSPWGPIGVPAGWGPWTNDGDSTVETECDWEVTGRATTYGKVYKVSGSFDTYGCDCPTPRALRNAIKYYLEQFKVSDHIRRELEKRLKEYE